MSVAGVGPDTYYTTQRQVGGGLGLTINLAPESIVCPYVTGFAALCDYEFKDWNQTGTLYDKDSETPPIYGGEAGARLFLTSGASLNLSLYYRNTQLEKECGGPQADTGVMLGFSIFF
ncbi:unnamed protein product [marine sediment metagenome]|uniref:Outer membrane protein beta-barrel domain-containing protein n=1 Tax=marine sediment metagenome TaxID=412755 RepID=X0XYK9_9ZZZZ